MPEIMAEARNGAGKNRPTSLDTPIADGKSDNQDSNNISPQELFKRMAANDAKQNKRLTQDGKLADKPTAADYSKGPTKMRFIVCTLGLMSLAMSQMSRIVINQSITRMVKQVKRDEDAPSDGSCPWPDTSESLPIDEVLHALESTSPAPDFGLPAAPSASLLINDLQPEDSLTTNETQTHSSFGASTLPNEAQAQAQHESSDARGGGGHMQPILSDAEVEKLKRDEWLQAEPDTEEAERLKDGGVDEDLAGDGARPVSSEAAPEPKAEAAPEPKAEVEAEAEERFDWSIQDQSYVLGGFYYSYFVFMILGGRLAEIYGAKYIILLSVIGSALINLATPWMARTSFLMLVLSRVLMGALQSGVFPALYALIAKWLTMSEASIFAPLIKMNLRLGMVFGSLVPGLISSWPNVFYFTGFVSIIWSLAWILLATSDPADNRWVSPGELKHINRKKRQPKCEMIEMGGSQREGGGRESKKSTAATPWLKIFTAPSVIGLIVIKLTFNYALDFLAIELPSYLKYVHHASKETISTITTAMFSIQVVLIIFVGWLAKVAVQRRPFGASKTTIRKLFQCVASLGLAFCYLLLSFNDCNLLYVALVLQLMSFLSMFTAGGETMLPYDLSEQYPATIMSIANSIANLSGITTTTLAALILGDQGASYTRWNIFIYLVAGVNLVGGLVFVLLVKAEPIDFESKKSKKEPTAPIRSVGVDDCDTTIELDSPAKHEVGAPASEV